MKRDGGRLLTRHQRWLLRLSCWRLKVVAELEVDVVEVGVDLWAPGLKLPDGAFQCLHAVIALIADLIQPDELDVGDALLQISDA